MLGMPRDHRAQALLHACTLAFTFGALACTRAPREPAAIGWITTSDRQRLLDSMPLTESKQSRNGAEGGARIVRLTIDTAVKHQTMTGFGAALTDASVWVMQHHLSDDARERLLQELFSTKRGIGLGFLRVTIGASDFSPTHYTLDDAPAGVRDTSFKYFSIDRDREAKLPLLRRIHAINPALTVMATPWSAPAWMKTNGSLYGGMLRDDAMLSYAEYLRRAVEAYAAESVTVHLLSVQNEPDHEPKDYPGMRFPAAQRATFFARQIGPLFAARDVTTQLLDWDHNWDNPGSPSTVLGEHAASRYVHGVAWHCYAGNVDAQSAVHDRYPTFATYFTECSGGDWARNFGDNLIWNVQTLIIGAPRNWARGVALWNLALDEKHGPHLGGCNDCRGVVTIDSAAGAITRNEEYYALAHASRFVRPGAIRIASTSDTTIQHVAFLSSDQRLATVIIANPARSDIVVAITGTNAPVQLRMPARSVATVQWLAER